MSGGPSVLFDYFDEVTHGLDCSIDRGVLWANANSLDQDDYRDTDVRSRFPRRGENASRPASAQAHGLLRHPFGKAVLQYGRAAATESERRTHMPTVHGYPLDS